MLRALLTAVAVATCIFAVIMPAGPAAAQTVDPATAARLDRHIDAISELYGTAGASVAILSGDRVVYTHNYGYQNIAAGTPATADSAYTIWSMSKLFFDIEVLRAVEAGRIDLDDTLGELFDDLPEAWRPISLRLVWSHMSGLPDFISEDGFPPDAQAAFAVAMASPPPAAPGSESRYNQTNFLLLGQLLERVTSTPYPSLMQRNQVDPLGLAHTRFGYDGAAPDQALNYRASREDDAQLAVIQPPDWPDYVYTSVGLQASLGDMVRWSQALVRGELAPRDTLLALWRPQRLSTGAVAEHAYGWEIEPRGAFTGVGHGGGGRVNLRHYFRNDDPAQSLTVIYLDNGGLQNFNHRGLSARLANMIWPNLASEEELLLGALAEAALRGDTAAAARAFRAHADASEDATGRRENELNRIGYAALRTHGAAAAIPVFEVEAALFSGSWNSQDSLGEAYLAVGRLEEALAQYHRAQVLNPQSQRLARIVAEIEAEIAAAR